MELVIKFPVFLQLCLLVVSTTLETVGSETTEVPWCGLTDSGYRCVGRQGQLLIIPCGGLSDQQGLSFTYTLQWPQQVLANGTVDYLHWYPQWNETGLQICCIPNISISLHNIPCYQLDILYSPIVVPMTWPAGVGKWPTHESPFELNCPLQSNPPANYTWTKYQSLGRKVKMNFTDDVVFSDNGRRWSVASYSASHNGVYDCHAVNALGEADYRDDILFFLKPHACPAMPALHSIVTISQESTHKPNDNITLTCTVHDPGTYGLQPLWFYFGNGTQELCRPPLYSRQHPIHNKTSCTWSNTLTVYEFREELAGEYVCHYGKLSATATVEMEVCYTYSDADVSVSLSPARRPSNEIVISCIVSNLTIEHNIHWILPNSSDLCLETADNSNACTSEYEIEQSYNEQACQWTSNLVIEGHSKSWKGVYECVVVGSGNRTIARKAVTIDDLVSARIMDNNNGDVDNAAIGTSVGVAVVLAMSIVLLLILCKVHHLRKPSFSRSKEPPRTGFKYDIFISAHDETRQLIEENILVPLETESNPGYEVCWHLRDFIAGVSIGEQIADAVNHSRKILFIFSKHFSESKFCQLELDLAMKRLMLTRTRCLVPIALNEAAVPKRLKNMLTYWPIVMASEENLLEKMKQLIGAPIQSDTADISTKLEGRASQPLLVHT